MTGLRRSWLLWRAACLYRQASRHASRARELRLLAAEYEREAARLKGDDQ